MGNLNDKEENKENIVNNNQANQEIKLNEQSSNEASPDLTFKKVNVNAKNRLKKSHGFLKTILFLIMIIIVIYCIFFARNCIILTDLSNKIKILDKKVNYSYTSIAKMSEEEDTTIINYARKDNKELFEIKIGENIISMWEDIANNKRITMFPTEKIARITSKGEMGVNLPVMKELKDKSVRSLMSIASRIYSEKYEGKDCYVITIGNAQKVWIEKQTGLVQKREYETYTVEYVNIKIDNNSKIDTPDLTGYVVNEE